MRGWKSTARAQSTSAFRVFENWLLPQPSVRGRRLRLAGDVAYDFAAVLLAAWLVGRMVGLAVTPLRLGAQYGTLFTLLGYSERLYEQVTIRSAKCELLVLGKCVMWSGLIWGGLTADFGINFVLALSPLLYAGLMLRRVIGRWLACCRRIPNGEKNVLIVGAGRTGRELAEYLERAPFEKRCVVGFIDENAIISGQVRGRVEDLGRLAETEFIDEIILAGVPGETARRAIWEARECGIDVKLVPETYGTPVPSLEQFGDIPVLTVREERIPGLGRLIKRAVDVLGAALGLILTSPLLAAIALAIRLDSGGSIFYAAPRVGYKGRRFNCYKFRTMVADADSRKYGLLSLNERQGACFKIENDPRITATGRWLRRYSLDELPQLWNVLRGEMSLVGPRPHPLDDFSRYRTQDMKRLSALPGLTGLWQVTARRDPSFERNIMLDREYIEHWSLAGDFKILFKTVAAVVQGSGT
jgi:exopolysaccharide biosynthesis polyprenyl glycosylphosphotransferase